MRSRRWLTWLVFTVCALAVVEGLGWVTYQALKLEGRERDARAQAQFQESTRLALWRMESELTPLVAQEAARPYFQYQPFYPADRAYTRMWQEVQPGEVLVPSPLLETSGQFIRLHFQISHAGQLTSPQAPTGNMRDLAENRYVESEFIVLAGQMLDELAAMSRAQPLDLRTAVARSAAAPVRDEPPPAAEPEPQQQKKSEATGQLAQSVKEYEARQQAAQSANVQAESYRNRKQTLAGKNAPDKQLFDQLPAPAASASRPLAAAGDAKDREINRLPSTGRPVNPAPASDPIKVDQGPLEPTWRRNPATGADELLFRRWVRVQDQEITQGFWIDWPGLQAKLLAAAADLVPGARLSPVSDGASEVQAPSARRLAAIPVLLDPGPVPAIAAEAWTPTHITLGVTWLAVLGAIVAIAIVLRTAMELGDRRGRFVSAVTHELRTPLTTFCLYTEMLADGMVGDEGARRQYLGTLKGESRRLAAIVENVLDYARLGGSRRAHGLPMLRVPDLLARVLPPLQRRAEQGEMSLDVELSGLEGAEIAVDAPTLERILLNLVDNACKYASGGSDDRLHLSARLLPGRRCMLEIRIRDHGPGIPAAERRKIFLPFHRTRRDAEGSQSGLGLGLALARGLARGLGGELALVRDPTDGAEFRLNLPCRIQTGY